LSGSAWPSRELNPYLALQTRKPDEEIDHGIMVYRGDVHMEAVVGTSRAFMAWSKLLAKQPQEALALAEEGVRLSPDDFFAQWALGDAAGALGKKHEARAAYEAALAIGQKLAGGVGTAFEVQIEASLKKL
jgi:tetratricopeptide (TPR) repeat protein